MNGVIRHDVALHCIEWHAMLLDGVAWHAPFSNRPCNVSLSTGGGGTVDKLTGAPL